MPPHAKHDRPGSSRIAATRPVGVEVPTEHQRFSRSDALSVYERELAWYRADEPYLTVEKAAQRCVKLSMLLTQAHVG